MFDDDLLREYEAPRALSASSRARRRRIVAALVIVALILVAIGRWTEKALSSDTSAIASSSFVTGSVDISADHPVAVVGETRMAPGDTVFRVIKVVNSGSLQYRYAVVASSTDPDGKRLATQLEVAAYLVPSTAQCSPSGVAGLTALGPVRPVLAKAPQVQPLFGDVAKGQQAGDQVMAAVGTELLCLGAHLPGATGNSFGSASTALNLKFVAEQTADNS